MNASDRIKKSHVSIMRHKQFCAYAGILACGKVIMTTEIPTACTDGWDVSYNPAFVDGMSDPELNLLVLHEATHKAYRHLHVWQGLWKEDARLANIAMDHFVNLSLMDTDDGAGFLKMPKAGVQPEPKYRGWAVSRIFDDLKQNPPPQPPNKPGTGSSGEPQDGMDSHEWGKAEQGDAAEEAKQAEEVQRAMRQGEMVRRKMQGKGTGGADGVFGDLLTPKVDWRKVLRDFITETCAGRDESSWRKPNRRFLAEDVYMPSMVGTTMTNLVVLFDTSGSCFGGEEMTRFVSELATIVGDIKPTKAHVLYVDTSVAGHQIFEEGQFAVHQVAAKGGGGTDLPVAFPYVRDKNITPDAMVVLTDGYTPFGEAPGYPVLWAMTSDMQAPYGTTISIGT
jgi:predicted metal-dependent peptidase